LRRCVSSRPGRCRIRWRESRSEGTLSFAFTPGKAATLKVLTPPASFCLLFSVPKAFKTGTVSGLGAAPLALPALAAAKP
jgi:hypothetical protein